MDWTHNYKYKRCCMLEEGCLFLCLVSSEVIILIGWLIAPLRSVSMVWEGWSGLDVVIETDNTVSTQHNGTYIKKQSGSGQNANANSFNFNVLGPQQNTPKNNLYWSNTFPANKMIQSLEMMLPVHCFSHYLVVGGGKKSEFQAVWNIA